jgi:large subunit ribosomal protein L24
MNKIKVNDLVVVNVGKDAGKTGKVLSVNKKKSVAIVEGLNQVKKAIKPTQQSPEGGFAIKSLPVHLSNVSLVSPKTKKPSKVKFETGENGRLVRVLKKCGTKL